jgi:two-component system sensor histidine kinase HupT/HoxJ
MEPSVDAAWTAADRHTERLSALGTHIARVAHELNAPVSLIAGSLGNLDQQIDALLRYVEATRARAAHDPVLDAAYNDGHVDYVLANARTLLAICDEGVQRVSHVVEQLRSYARRARTDALQRQVIDVVDVLRRALRLASKGRQGAPAIDWEIDDRLPPLCGDRELLGQAFVNLLANAIDATAGKPAPHIAISCRPRGDAGIEIRIRDNGPGIAPNDHAAVFEPFFTTKSAGTGLGLAIAKDAIEQHGGTIALDESARTGAEFVITLGTEHGGHGDG